MTGKTPCPSSSSLEADYDNRAAVSDHPAIIARWLAQAAAVRERLKPLDIAYGPGPREVMHLFPAGPQAPVALFIHGGYWRAFDRDAFSWVAPALLEHGVSVSVASYDLAPDVRLGRIVGQMRQATGALRARTGARPMVFGHSAGGHLAACLLSEGRVCAAVAISGLFDLRPLIHTTVNDALMMDDNEAAALSPIFWPAPNGGAPGGTILDCIVGGDETAAFIGQSRDMADLWKSKGVQTRFQALDGLNHFTVIDDLADADSALVKRIAALAQDGMG